MVIAEACRFRYPTTNATPMIVPTMSAANASTARRSVIRATPITAPPERGRRGGRATLFGHPFTELVGTGDRRDRVVDDLHVVEVPVGELCEIGRSESAGR